MMSERLNSFIVKKLMKKFLYVFNYPPEDKDLCALEFRAMFKQEYTSKYYLSNKDYDVNKSVFMKAKIDIWGINQSFCELIKQVASLNKSYQDFKVIYLKNVEKRRSIDRLLKKYVIYPIKLSTLDTSIKSLGVMFPVGISDLEK